MKLQKKALIILFFIFSLESIAQTYISFHSDLGSTQSSEGIYLKSSIQGQYEYKKYILSTGIENSIIGANPKFISGVFVNAGRKFQLKSSPIKLYAFYLWNNPGEFIREHNCGVIGDVYLKRFNVKIGTHFRTLYYKGLLSSSLHENWNILYDFNYNIKKETKPWNAGIGITNIDFFLLNQETNPNFYLKGTYNIKNQLSVFIENRYKSSGSLNASVHYYGFFVRTGIKWLIEN